VFLGKGNDAYVDEFRLKNGETNDTADSDAVFGGAGSDRIDLRDGDGEDFASCGPGEDTVWLDEGDTLLDDTCETVNEPEEEEETVDPTPTAPPPAEPSDEEETVEEA
jgi:hypothetical protein